MQYKFRKGIEPDHTKSLESKDLPDAEAMIEHAKQLSADNGNNFVEVYEEVETVVDEVTTIESRLVAVVHTKVTNGVNQFLGDGVYTVGVGV